MKLPSFCFVITTLFAASLLNAEVLMRIDENGKKIFYNVPPKIAYKVDPLKAGEAIPLKYSKMATAYTPLVEQACKKYSVDPDLVKAVIQVESAYNPGARSHKGAVGLMQLMPGTAERFGVKEIYDPSDNVHGGVQYLKFLLDLFNHDLSLAVAAYNAGEGAVQKFKGIPRYTETQNYVRKVLTLYGKEDYASAPVPKTIYKFVDKKGIVNFTTERPIAGVAVSR